MRVPIIALAGALTAACVAGATAHPQQAARPAAPNATTAAQPAAVSKAAAAPAQVAAAGLPVGPGRDQLVRSCSTCHEPTVVVGQRHDLAEWNELIDTMIARGASVSDPDHAVIATYLTQNFGKPK